MSEKSLLIEIWEIERLVPYAKNAKKHPQEQIKKLAASIKQFGWTQPIIVWTDGSIIAGHGRRLAALDLGLTHVPVLVRSDLTKIQADTLRLADNKVASTEYDALLVAESVRELNDLLQIDGSQDSFHMLALCLEDREIEMFTADLGEMNTDDFTDNVSGEVAKLAAANKDKAKQIDKETVPVSKLFGKTITVEQHRKFSKLMTHVETRTGVEGIEGLMLFVYRALKGIEQ